MLDIVVIIVAVSIVVAIITSLEYLSRICDWAEQIYSRQGMIIQQNINIQRQLGTLIDMQNDMDGLEIIPMMHPRSK